MQLTHPPATPAPVPPEQAEREAARANRAMWVNRVRAAGGHLMPDTSTDKIEYMVIPSGHTSAAQVLAKLREIPPDAEPGYLAPTVGQSGEPEPGERTAWIFKLTRNEPDSIPTPVRMIPRPVCQILVGSQRHPLVFTADDVAILIAPESIERNTWLTNAGGLAATTFRMKDITTEAFRRLAYDTPVIRTEPRLDSRGRLMLLPRGIMPPGWRNLSPTVDRDSAWLKWQRAAEIVAGAPGGIAAHVWGAAVASEFIRLNRRQSHAIDVHGRDTHTGKSTLVRSVGAMIGDPLHTARPCDFASSVSATSYAGQISYGFIPVDESQLFKGDADERARMVFRLCESGVRTRSLQDGSGVTDTKPFGGLFLLTGNLRFVSAETIDRIYPGLSRRYLPFYVDEDHPVFRDDAEATTIADLTNSAYGWFIPFITESLTNDQFMLWDEEIRGQLYEQYPDENPEVLKLFAFHLAGCRAIDTVFHTATEEAARASVHAQAKIAMHRKADLQEVFLDAIRDHIQVNSGKWVTPAEYVKFQTRDDDGGNTFGIDREIVGIRADDSSWFMVLGQPMLNRLCAEFGIADPDAVITALDRAEMLKITDGERKVGKKTTKTRMGAIKDRQINASGYHVLAPAIHPGDASEPDSDGGPLAPEPDSGPAPVADPFAQSPAPVSVPAPAPEPTADYPRPAWIPEPLRKTTGADGRTIYGGVVTAWNKLWEAQQKRPTAHVHNHPYPADDDIPEPLRLVGNAQGTYVHEGTHNYVNRDVPAGTPITVLDRNAAFLSAIGTAVLPIDGLASFDGAGDSKLTGIYHIESWPELIGDGAHPWGVLKPSLTDSPLWVTRETLNLGQESAGAGIIAEPRVIESLLGRQLKPGKPGTARLEWIYGQLRDARAAAITARDSDTEGFIKAVYSVGISTMGESGSNNRIWRPELPPIIRSASFANNYRLARKFTAAGLTVAAIKNNDEIHLAASPDAIFAPVGPNGKPVANRGRGLAEIKVKSGYTMGTDGRPEPGTEWSNYRA